jgi:hypothetical protein
MKPSLASYYVAEAGFKILVIMCASLCLGKIFNFYILSKDSGASSTTGAMPAYQSINKADPPPLYVCVSICPCMNSGLCAKVYICTHMEVRGQPLVFILRFL